MAKAGTVLKLFSLFPFLVGFPLARAKKAVQKRVLKTLQKRYPLNRFKGYQFWEEDVNICLGFILRFTQPSSFRRRLSLRKKHHFYELLPDASITQLTSIMDLDGFQASLQSIELQEGECGLGAFDAGINRFWFAQLITYSPAEMGGATFGKKNAQGEDANLTPKGRGYRSHIREPVTTDL